MKGVAVPSSGRRLRYSNARAIRDTAPRYGHLERPKCTPATTGQPRTLPWVSLGQGLLQIDGVFANVVHGSASVPMWPREWLRRYGGHEEKGDCGFAGLRRPLSHPWHAFFL